MGLILPLNCVQCRTPTNAALCLPCRENLEFLQPHGRCRFCFSDDELIDRDLCAACLEHPLYHSRAASALAYEGVGSALVRALTAGGCAYLARGCASVMFLQFEKLGWETPDVVVPMPMPRLRQWLHGYSPTQLLGEALAKLLGVPCKPRGQHILLIDDLMKPTLNHYAAQLIGKDARRIDILTLCRKTW